LAPWRAGVVRVQSYSRGEEFAKFCGWGRKGIKPDIRR
jgi:hypothetical protein